MRLRQLEALVKMVPTQEEEAKLLSYEGNIGELGFTENFVISILKIPFAFQRVEAMLYRETFEDEVNHLRNSFSILEVTKKNSNINHHKKLNSLLVILLPILFHNKNSNQRCLNLLPSSVKTIPRDAKMALIMAKSNSFFLSSSMLN